MKPRVVDDFIIDLLVDEVLELEDALIPLAILEDDLQDIDRQATIHGLRLALLPLLCAKYAYWGQVGALEI